MCTEKYNYFLINQSLKLQKKPKKQNKTTEKGAGKEKRKKWETACFRPILYYHCKREIILSFANREEVLASGKYIVIHTHMYTHILHEYREKEKKYS